MRPAEVPCQYGSGDREQDHAESGPDGREQPAPGKPGALDQGR